LVAADPAESFDVDALVSAGVSEVVSRPIIADEVAADWRAACKRRRPMTEPERLLPTARQWGRSKFPAPLQ
jgi:hypothetical protein